MNKWVTSIIAGALIGTVYGTFNYISRRSALDKRIKWAKAANVVEPKATEVVQPTAEVVPFPTKEQKVIVVQEIQPELNLTIEPDTFTNSAPVMTSKYRRTPKKVNVRNLDDADDVFPVTEKITRTRRSREEK